MSLDASARCAAHPVEPAAAVCARCGAFICTNCLRDERGQPHCLDCAERLKREDQPSDARQALLLAVVGLGLFPVAAVALVHALRAHRRARAGAAREQELRLAGMATRVAVVGLVWPLFAAGWIAASG